MQSPEDDDFVFLEKKNGQYVVPDYVKVEQQFDAWAKEETSYDKAVSDSHVYTHFHSIALQNVPLLGNKCTILDIGCGSGMAGVRFIQDGHKMHGIDLSAEMLALAKKRGYSSTTKLDVFSQQMPLKEQFSTIISVGMIGDYVPLEKALLAFSKIISAGSYCVFTCAHPMHTRQELSEIITKNGFEMVYAQAENGFIDETIIEEKYWYVVAKKL